MANVAGGLSGAGAGAAIGTALLPGIGTAIGAIGGGLIGAFAGGGGGDDDKMPNIVDPVTGQQIGQAQDQTQTGLQQQQAFVNALNAQNGIQNQSNVYNQLQGVANGTGPNPAQAMLSQATGANVANQAALMASQRGSSANSGLLARQAAMQGANIQQNAAGQGATMQANQSLNAIGAAGNMANQQVGQQANAIGNYNQFAQNNQGQLLNAQSQYNNAMTSGKASENSANQIEAQRNANQVGGLLNGAGAAAGAIAGGLGASGGSTPIVGTSSPTQGPNLGVNTTFDTPKFALAQGGEIGPASFVARHMKGIPQYAHGGKVDALVSAGERYLSPKEVEKVAKGKKAPIKAGEKIPGKPKVGGAVNSYANDTVHKKLEAGGVVLPRSVTQSKNPGKAAEAFVSALLAKQGLKK